LQLSIPKETIYFLFVIPHCSGIWLEDNETGGERDRQIERETEVSFFIGKNKSYKALKLKSNVFFQSWR
jgi:Zn-finger nucleic acid-binding protein